MRALPPVATRVSSNPDAYVYLAESIRAWPDQPALAGRLQRRGLGERGLAQPHRRHRGAAPRHEPARVARPVSGFGARGNAVRTARTAAAGATSPRP